MFAYCNNNPVNSYDPAGTERIHFQNCALGDTNLGVGGGGGIIVNFTFWETISRSISNISYWVDTQQGAIKAVLILSLAKASPRKYKTEMEEHHLVAKKSRKAAEAAKILNKVLIQGVEDPLNKVWLDTKVHRRIHTNLYYTFANELVIRAYSEAEGDPSQQYANVTKALNILRTFVESLNKLSSN